MALYRNAEGYRDPTAGAALAAVGREERTAAKRNRRPVVYVCSRFAGDVRKNIRRARRFCRFAVELGYAPVAAHLLYPQFLNDGDPNQRRRGIACGKTLMDRCDEVWFFGTRFSAGMREEYLHAARTGKRIRLFTLQCRQLNGKGGAGGTA